MNEGLDLAGLGKGRIEALSDGVFAIAMTLLVFNLKVPTFNASPTNQEIWDKLVPMWHSFSTYIIAFISLGIYWIGHHNVFASIRRSDRVILWFNICFLLFVAFLPFTTTIFSEAPNNQVTTTLFGLNLFVIGIFLYWIWRYASTHDGFVPLALESDFRSQVNRRILITPAMSLVGVVVAFWSPVISTIVYFSMIPLFIIVPSQLDKTYAIARKESAKVEAEQLALKRQTARWTDI